MKKVLIQSATILDPGSQFHEKVLDILIVNGAISKIGSSVEKPDGQVEVISAEGHFLAPGFVDMNANIGEPGLETKEDLESGARAASSGGYTAVALMPNTQPPIHSKAEVSYVVNRSSDQLVQVYPMGCISHNREGKEMAEMYDMKGSGAVAFTDGNRPVSSSGLMSRALLYTKSFDGLIVSFAEDQEIAGKAKMHEGNMSTYLGMKGNPSLAEELMVSRDLYLAEYNDSRIHFTTISSAGSVELIRRAKKAGTKVTCDVAAHHLVLTDDELEGFDSNYKVKPPLREESDRKALLEGIKDGTIDAIVSQHTPHEIEYKAVEFEIAYYGMIGFQTALPLAVQAGLTPEQIVQLFSINPRRILKLQPASISEGQPADLVLFDPKEEWRFDGESNASKSSNSPFLGKKLKGKVKLVMNKGKSFINQ